MAEPPKAKRPSRSKTAPEPDFSPFEDWLIDGPAGQRFPHIWGTGSLTEKQKEIVASNAKLLLDSDAWQKKVSDFKYAIAMIPNIDLQKEVRSSYEIRFDQYKFEEGKKNFSGYEFPCSVSFAGTNFGEGDVSFSEARFDIGDVSFTEAIFGNGDVKFVATIFGDGDVWFESAVFGLGTLWFSGAKFGVGKVWFNDVVFRSTSISAPNMEIGGDLYISSKFPEDADFSGLFVKGSAEFTGSRFSRVPDFLNAKFERGPELSGMRVSRPKLIGWNRVANSRGDVGRFRKLKSMALASNDHEMYG